MGIIIVPAKDINTRDMNFTLYDVCIAYDFSVVAMYNTYYV